jgi:uroporphyrinogen-III decarboxylase
MLPKERISKVIALEKPDKVPVAPQVNEHAARVLGVPYGDVFNSAELAAQALLKCYQVYQGVDMAFGGGFGFVYYSPFADAHSSWFYKWKLPKPGEDEVPQMLEEQIISGDQYDLLMEKGLLYFIRPDHPEISQFISMLIKMAEAMRPAEQKAKELGLFNYMLSLINIPTDIIANLRGLNGYLTDFYDRPEKIKQACDWLVDDLIAMGLKLAEQVVAGKPDASRTILIGANRASASYISPKMFEEFAWPYFFKEVMAIINAGYTPVIHLDGNWTPMAGYFRAFPKTKCLFHVDDQNDIFEWKKILGDHSALMGNVPASLLAHGSAAEVDDYCRKLIEAVGEGGGFILANACALPYDAKVENVQTMIRASEKYGVY